MKLSIITINYNNCEGLKKTIASVMSQTWRDFEWIIIDGGSTDGSKEVIEEVAANPDSNITYWCSEPDKGIYNALNKGISHCMGEYISCMNSGDCFYERRTLFNVFSRSISSDVLYGNCIFDDGVKSTYVSYNMNVDIFFLIKDNLCHQSMFVKTSLQKSHPFNENFTIAADYYLWLQLICENKKFEYVNVTVCKYDVTGKSSQYANLELHVQERLQAQREIVPEYMLAFLRDCYTFETDEMFQSYKSIYNNGGWTYECIVIFFKMVNLISNIKRKIHAFL